MTRPLIEIRHASVSLEGSAVLRNVSWKLRPGEHWAILGANGSGKSTFLRLVRGDLRPDPDGRGRRVYALAGDPCESPIGAREKIAFVSPERQDAYTRNNWDLTGEEVIHTGFFDSVWLQEKPKADELEAAERVITLLKIGDLRHTSILAMSEGEARKVLIARSLAPRPRIMIFDEVCSGLDGPSRRLVLAAVQAVIRSGTQVIYATHRTEELVPTISRVLVMRQGRIERQGGREDVISGPVAGPSLRLRRAARSAPEAERPRAEAAGVLIEVTGADVYFDGKEILHGLRWRMKCGQNWAVLGRNGSGKTTFLRLITGDLRPARGGRVRWFGSGRRSIWEIRRRVGVVSADLQARYDHPVTVAEAVCSGFFASIGLYSAVTAAHRRKALSVLRSFGLGSLAERDVRSLSYGEMRRVLISRALVRERDILILDEPCSGLDAAAREEVLRMVQKIGRGGTTLVLVTHHPEDLVPSITHLLLMEGGRIAAEGEKAVMLKDRRLAELLGS